jgi:hypothetical protein
VSQVKAVVEYVRELRPNFGKGANNKQAAAEATQSQPYVSLFVGNGKQ